MYKVIWYKKTNLLKLVESVKNEADELKSPRVVFTDELRLLGIDKYTYSHQSVPVCWCMDRRYFYEGKLIFEVRGGDLYHAPRIIFPEELPFTHLTKINVEELKKINYKILHSLRNEAMDFINDQYEFYVKRVDAFAVAFSGGKDSQVTLDLVSRVIPPDKYKVYYTDTGMELPCTFEIVNRTEKHYKSLYNDFDLIHCNSDDSVVDQWKKYGPPSRMNRWCCKVRKTALFARKLKDTLQTKKQPKCVVFEGVRAEESARRELYNRVGDGVKHVNLINCRPIFEWNNTEIYIYMLCMADVELNYAYKLGLTRVGCNICPFASSWSEYIINQVYPDLTAKFIPVIETMAKNIGVHSQDKIDEYISSGNWKKNAGGKGLTPDDTRMDVLKKDPDYECIVKNPKQEWKIWLNTMGEYNLVKLSEKKYNGEINVENDIIKISVDESDKKIRVLMSGTSGKLKLTSLMNKVLTKTAFCERCGVCEAECPTGALRIRKDEFSIDNTVCIHCHNCYEVNSYGCIVAARRHVSEGGTSMGTNNMRSSGIDRYSTFGLRSEWVSALVDMQDEWFNDYLGLGNKMIPAAINWLREGEIIELKEKKLSSFGKFFCELFRKNEYLAWQILWINLCFNSQIVNFYVSETYNNTNYSKNDILALLQYKYPNLKENTLSNPIGALINMFEKTPFGCEQEYAEFTDYSLKMGAYITKNREKMIKKIGTNNISKISIAYLLYKQAEASEQYEYSVEDFYERNIMGPKIVFNYPLENFHSVLRNLTESGYLSADLLGGLDNIHLDNRLSSKKVLEEMVKNL